MAESRKKSQTQEEEDLISNMPDEILTQILSYVNTNSAVATSVLSKRWKLVWISVPNLEFDYSKSIHDLYELYVCYENLVDRVLSLNNVMSVRNINLNCYNCDDSRVVAWLESLAARDAEKCHLYLPTSFLEDGLFSSNMNLIPAGFFDQKNLVELELGNVVVDVPSTICFPCLKTITLEYVKLAGDEPLKNLLSGCPAITDLLLRSSERFRYKKLYVCSPTLRNIKLYATYDEIVFDAPSISCLHLKAGVSYEIIDLSSLVKAYLFTNRGSATIVTKIYELLGKISHVKELILDESTTWALISSALVNMPMLYNLTHITLSGITSGEALAFQLRLLMHTGTPDGVRIILKLDKTRGSFGSGIYARWIGRYL